MSYWRGSYFRRSDAGAGYWRVGYWRDIDFPVTTPSGGSSKDGSAVKYLLDEKRRLQRLYRDDEDVLSIIIAFLTTGGRR